MSQQNKGSVWRIWDLHLHSPCSILNNGFGDPKKEETWEYYINNIENKCREKNIAALGITDYFTIEGYKKVKISRDKGRLEGILILPNIEFRLDKVITVDGLNAKRLNFHVILSPKIDPEDIEERFLHELDFIYQEDTFESSERRKLKMRDLEDFGRQLKEDHPPFRDKSDLFIGCMNAVVDPNQIKKILESKPSIFKGKYFIVFPGEGQSLLKWDSQLHGVRKHLLQMSHAIFSSENSTRDFGLGIQHGSKKLFLKEFKSLKPCIWGCDSHSFDERFLEPSKNSQDKINYCWIKSELTWDGLKQIIYEPKDRIRIQEECPEPQKSIYTIDKFYIRNTNINPNLSIGETELDLNHNLVAIIGGRGSGKTAILDLIASCYSEGKKLEQIANSFYYRLYCKESNEAIPVKLTCISQDSVEKNVGEDKDYFELADIIYLTQKHFEEFSGDNKKLNEYVLRLIFEKFPENRKTYDEYQSAIKDGIKQIQEANLKLQHIEEEIKIKTELEIRLKQKGGEHVDYVKRIQDIESQSKINKEANELEDKLTEQKKSKQKIESIIYKLNNIPEHTTSLANLLNHLSESNKDADQIKNERSIELALFPETDLAKYLERINETARGNRDILISELEQIEKDISDINGKLQQFQDINKTLRDLKQKQISIEEEMAGINTQVINVRKKEEEINILKGSRLLLFVDVIQKYAVLRDFIKEMMGLFEVGKDEILNGLSFDATIIINEDKYIVGINSIINNRMISEKDVRSQLRTSILERTKDLVEMTIKDNQEYESKIYELSDNFEKEIQDFISKLKKHITHSEFYNNLFAVPVEIEIKISLEKISLESLSMGQKAIVLLKIILAYDDKPLIIDQPEEDLDNRYIYEQLVSAFRAAKEKRQIIIATHNANLTVNTDAEQIIIAKYENGRISYEAGTLENPLTRNLIKEILEGGDEAFEKREEKYGYKF